jgi:hypothetical protein
VPTEVLGGRWVHRQRSKEPARGTRHTEQGNRVGRPTLAVAAQGGRQG